MFVSAIVGNEEKNMEKQIIEISSTFVLPEERTRLVRLCARITGNVDAAEDLAQETLLEAWRNKHTLRDYERRTQWLCGVARNVCLRWQRKHGRDSAHLITPHPGQDGQDTALADLEDALTDDLDVEVVLERKELVELLDRALALLPMETRAVLVKRYVEESPLAEIAAQLGTNASAVAMRLQRGKLVLRRVLTREMRDELAPYDLHVVVDEWEETPLWCRICGQRRLLGKRDPNEGILLLKCPLCSPGADDALNRNHLPALQGVKGYKPLYSRLAAWCDHYYRTGLRNSSIQCERCGHMLPARISLSKDLPDWVRNSADTLQWIRHCNDRLVNIPCETCLSSHVTTLEGLVLTLPEGRHFLQTHPRIRTLPRQYIEADGRAAIVTSFESVTDNARLDVVSDYETYEVRHIYGEK
jgi:RNA polymerase sigma factor (sigma-70 family)